MVEETDNMADSRFQARGAAPFRRSRAAYFGAAILSGVTSAVGGSILCVTFAYAFRGDAVGLTEYVIILLMWCMYSGAVILPISVLVAFPLMVVFCKKSRFTKFLLSTATGAFCGGLIYFGLPLGAINLIEALAIATTYGGVFGVVAANLPRRDHLFFV